jgi:hypothetical protein
MGRACGALCTFTHGQAFSTSLQQVLAAEISRARSQFKLLYSGAAAEQ